MFLAPTPDIKNRIYKSQKLARGVFETETTTDIRVSRLLELTPDFLILYQDSTSTAIEGICPLGHNIKFQIILSEWHSRVQQGALLHHGIKGKKPCGIKFTDSITDKSRVFFQDNPDTIDIWKKALIRLINRVGFKSIFKTLMKIGKGSSASVYFALCLEDNTKVAVKAYPRKCLDALKLKGIYNQVDILRKLNQKNVNSLQGVYEENGELYVVLELLDGGQLTYPLQSKHEFTSAEIKSIIKGILKGLKHLAQRNIIHRDLKPDNIIFRTRNNFLSEVVIVDFGLAVIAGQKQPVFFRCGTPGYIAPEVLTSKHSQMIEPVVDMFSLGVIFHQLLTGHSVFEINNNTEEPILARNRKCNFSLNSRAYDIYTRGTVDLLKKMLDTNPYTRISAEEALEHPFFTEREVRRESMIGMKFRKDTLHVEEQSGMWREYERMSLKRMTSHLEHSRQVSQSPSSSKSLWGPRRSMGKHFIAK